MSSAYGAQNGTNAKKVPITDGVFFITDLRTHP
jgi:hypothetical protein